MPLWVVIVVAWLLLSIVVGLFVGRVIHNRDRKPPHVEPGPQPRKSPQRWPLDKKRNR